MNRRSFLNLAILAPFTKYFKLNKKEKFHSLANPTCGIPYHSYSGDSGIWLGIKRVTK